METTSERRSQSSSGVSNICSKNFTLEVVMETIRAGYKGYTIEVVPDRGLVQCSCGLTALCEHAERVVEYLSLDDGRITWRSADSCSEGLQRPNTHRKALKSGGILLGALALAIVALRAR